MKKLLSQKNIMTYYPKFHNILRRCKNGNEVIAFR